MSMETDFVGGLGATVSGLGEVSERLRTFPEKLQRSAIKKMLRAGGSIVVRVARGKVRKVSGRLARQIRATIVVDRRTGHITARIIAGRRQKKDDAFYAWMVEGGTKPHEIRPKGKKSLFLAGLFSEVVQHPGAEAKPFLGPALEESVQPVLEVMRAQLEWEIGLMGGGSGGPL